MSCTCVPFILEVVVSHDHGAVLTIHLEEFVLIAVCRMLSGGWAPEAHVTNLPHNHYGAAVAYAALCCGSALLELDSINHVSVRKSGMSEDVIR